MEEIWPRLPRIAVDHAVAEPAAAAGRVATVPAAFDWEDVGDFDSLAALLGADGVPMTVLGDADVHLGELDVGLERAVPVWMSKAQHEYWKHTVLTIDVVEGRGAGFSLEAPYGVRFLTRSRLADPPG